MNVIEAAKTGGNRGMGSSLQSVLIHWNGMGDGYAMRYDRWDGIKRETIYARAVQ